MKDTLLKIIRHFGVNHQKRKFGEECNELKEAITEYELAKRTNRLLMKVDSNAYLDLKAFKNHIIEEIGDVYVVLLQFQEYYGIETEEVVRNMLGKIKRTEKIVEDEINNIQTIRDKS